MHPAARNGLVAIFGCLLSGLASATQTGGYVLTPPIVIDPDVRFVNLTASADGQAILITWERGRDIFYRVSRDGGLSLERVRRAAEAPRNPPGTDTLVDFYSESVPVLAADGSKARLFASIQIDTFYFPRRLPPFATAQRPLIYSSDDLSGQFRPTQQVTAFSDYEDPETYFKGFKTTLDMTANHAADRLFAVWNISLVNGGDYEDHVMIARGAAESRYFETPVDLSMLPLSVPYQSDLAPRVAVDGQGAIVFVAWYRLLQGAVIVRSTDGGENWSEAFGHSAEGSPDLDLASSASRLVVASSDGTYPVPTRIAVQTSDDLAASFTPETIVAQGNITPRIIVSEPKVAISSDGQVIALLYEREDCDPVWGCGRFPVKLQLAVSQDGGVTFDDVGTAAETFFDHTHDVFIRSDGQVIFLVGADEQSGAAIFRRAVMD